jgi:hypothetical protein
MGILFFYVLFALLVGAFGSDKTVGFWGAFFWSLLLSPLIGIIIVIASKTKAQEALERGMINKLTQPNQIPQKSLTEQLTQLEDLKSKNLITDEEYQKMRQKIMAQV